MALLCRYGIFPLHAPCIRKLHALTQMAQYFKDNGLNGFHGLVARDLLIIRLIRKIRCFFILCIWCICTTVSAQEDSTDVFFRHLQLNELTVTGVTGDTKLKHATAPVSIVSPQVLRATTSTNIIDAIAHQPGVSQLTTGGSISKPIIRGLGYNRVVVMSEGVRQEGQQWGDEHGVEVDGSSVNSVEILKGPASLMYGSDAMAGVVILHAQPTLAEDGPCL